MQLQDTKDINLVGVGDNTYSTYPTAGKKYNFSALIVVNVIDMAMMSASLSINCSPIPFNLVPLRVSHRGHPVPDTGTYLNYSHAVY